jgi:sugar/nucleoside kinase (ribokinase family)
MHPPRPQLDFLSIGHITRDLQPDGAYSLGGTVTFATVTAYHLGLVAGIVTCISAQDAIAHVADLPSAISLHICPSEQTTTFANEYHQGFRTQHLYAKATDLTSTDIPTDWLDAGIVLFGPLAQELDADMVLNFPRRPGTILAATPQGWLRRWDETRRVWPTPWRDAERVLPALDALILSHDDLLPFADGKRVEADALLSHWSTLVPLLVATDGRHGATLFREGRTQHFPSYSADEVDPTGAGDVFAAAFLTHLYRHHNPELAVDFANCVASFSITQPGIRGIPTLAMVEQRFQG